MLIHAGGSGVGTAAVQLVQLVGATAVVTAGSQAKIDVAVGLGAVTGFNYKDGNFAEKVLDHTKGPLVYVCFCERLKCTGSGLYMVHVIGL